MATAIHKGFTEGDTMQKVRLATDGQMARLLELKARKKLPFEDVKVLIDKHNPRKVRALRGPDPKPAFWEERFPGKGKALLEIVRPFYGWKPELKPAFPDLEVRGKQAMFWCEVKGVRAIRSGEEVSLGDSPWPSLGDSLQGSLQSSLRTSLRDSLSDSLGYSLWSSLEVSLRTSLLLSLFYACSFILVGKPEEAAKLRPLLALWLDGNFPRDLDKDRNLLVRVAD